MPTQLQEQVINFCPAFSIQNPRLGSQCSLQWSKLSCVLPQPVGLGGGGVILGGGVDEGSTCVGFTVEPGGVVYAHAALPVPVVKVG
jgi:hypothetical protein